MTPLARFLAALWAAWYISRSPRRDVLPFGNKPGEGEPAAPKPHYFRADFSPMMLARALDVMHKQVKDQTSLAIIEALQLAERIDTPFTPPVDWDRLERWAQRGYPLIDQITDGIEPKGEPGGPKC